MAPSVGMVRVLLRLAILGDGTLESVREEER